MAVRRRWVDRFNRNITIYLISNIVVILVGVILLLSEARVVNGGGDEGKALGAASAIGLSVIATGITGIAMIGYIILSDTTRNRVRLLADFGVRDYFEHNTTPISGEYAKRLRSRNKNIDILALGLNKLRTDFQEDFKSWAQQGSVRILLIDPTFPSSEHSYALQRDKEERSPLGKIAGEVELWLQETAQLRTEYPETFQIRLYRALPTITMVRMSNEIFWSPYLMHKTSSSTPTMVVKNGGHIFEMLTSHFDELWKGAVAPVNEPVADSTGKAK